MIRSLARLVVVSLLVLGGPARAAPARGPEGLWVGALEVAGTRLRLVFHVERQPDGALKATLDSPDQHATGIPVDRTTYEANHLRLELSRLGAQFDGALDGDKLVGSWTQQRTFPLALSRVEQLEPARRPQEPRRPFPYREEEVAISVRARPRDAAHQERITLGGTLTLPPGKGPFPAVVFITGSGSQDRDETILEHRPFLVLSDALTRRGIATLRLDDRGVGKSGGSAEAATTLDFAEDVKRELAWLAARPEIDRRAIGVLGHSEGGVIAPIVAASSELPRFVVMLAGTGMSGDRILARQRALIALATGTPEAQVERERGAFEQLTRRLRAAKGDAEADAAVQAFFEAVPAPPAAREEAARRMRSPWMRTFLALDPVAYLEKVRVPVLAISGDRDLQVPRENLPLIAAALRRGKNPDATTKLFPELNHLFQHAKTGAPIEYGGSEETFAPEALQLVCDWVVEHAKRLGR